MKLGEIYSKTNVSKKIPISYEIFPPKVKPGLNEAQATADKVQKIEALIEQLRQLKCFDPALISITYGAGGTNQESTISLAKKILNELEITPMQHFTCICSSKDFIKNYLNEIETFGIKNILALKGDMPQTDGNKTVCYQDFKYANELVDFINQNSDLEIAVAGYPEKHPTAESLDVDIKNLKCKIDAGGVAIFTQLFFDNENFYSYCDKVYSSGIKKPIIPGILPVTSFSQLERMSSMCAVKLPNTVVAKFEKFQNNEQDTIKMGVEFATLQCQKLMEFGVSGLHFYTLNKAHSTREIIQNLF